MFGAGVCSGVIAARWVAAGALGVGLGMVGDPGGAALAQNARQPRQLNPVYVDESTLARESLSRVRELSGAGNVNEAVRVLQSLLDSEGMRLLPVADSGQAVPAAPAASPDAPDTQPPGEQEGEAKRSPARAGADSQEALFEGVRAVIHRQLLGEASLLNAYRAAQQSRAQALLDGGDIEGVWQRYALTAAGLEAGLRRAQMQLEDARFEAARLTLEDLLSHPDLKDQALVDGAELYWSVARYLDRPACWETARQWLVRAGLPARNTDPIVWPGAARPLPATPLDNLGPMNRRGLIAKPLWTTPVNPDRSNTNEFLRMARRPPPGADTLPDELTNLSMLPAVANDTVYVSDGTSIQAFDRFTLSPRWPNKVTPGVEQDNREEDQSGFRPGMGGWTQRVDEPSVVSVQGDLLVACTGRTLSGVRSVDHVVSALDARSGRIRWSTSLSALDPALADAGARGPAVITEGRVLVAARKFLPERRLTVLMLCALDAQTGRLLWKQNVGSAGSLPFVSTTSQFDTTLVHDGIAYRADDLGVLGAFRVEDGTPVWVRTMPREAMQVVESARPWEIASPVVDDSTRSLVMLTPERDTVLRLAMDTGRVIAARTADAFGSPAPMYLLGVGDRLAAVGRQRIAFCELDKFESTSDIRLTPVIQARGAAPGAPEVTGINGRVVIAGGLLVCPTFTGVSVVNPAEPGATPEFVPLDRPGNLVTIDTQVVTLDDQAVHSYLMWDQAEQLLAERVKADPDDATPSVTLAELAYRADRPNRIVGAADAALAAIAREPGRESNREARARLFDALSSMALASLETQGAGDAAPSPSTAGPRITDLGLMEQIVARLAQVSQSPDERVARTMAAGRLAERRGKIEQAAKEYQSILDAPETASAVWEGPQVRVRAEIEAERRLAALVKTHGSQVYSVMDRAAAEALAALGDNAEPLTLRQLAERYPLSRAAPEVYLRLSRQYARTGDESLAASALERGLRAAERLTPADENLVGALAGELVVRLSRQGQVRSAQRVVDGVRARFPALRLTAQDGALDLAKVESDLARQIAETSRWPRIGALTGTNLRYLADATLLDPLLIDREPSSARLVALANDTHVYLYAAAGPGAAQASTPSGAPEPDRLPSPAASSGMAEVWSRPIEQSSIALLKIAGDSAYLAYNGRDLGAIERVRLESPGKARSAWKTPELSEVFPPEPSRLNPGRSSLSDRFPVPNEGLYSPRDPVFAMDDRTLAVVLRGGRAAAFDTDTGELLWTMQTGVGRVYDVDLRDGVLVVAGDEEVLSGQRLSGLRGAIQVLDARTGTPTQRIVDTGDHPRWVRVLDSSGAGGGGVIVAYEHSIASIDLVSGRLNWTFTHNDALPATTGWVVGETLVLQGPDRALWRVPLSSGAAPDVPLDGPRTHLEGLRPIAVLPMTGKAQTDWAVSTFQGLVIYGSDGTLKGVDALGGFEAVLPPAIAQGRAVTIETVSEGPTPAGQMVFNLYAMDTAGARIIEQTPVELGARPSVIRILDGRVLLSAGGVTVVLNAPAK